VARSFYQLAALAAVLYAPQVMRLDPDALQYLFAALSAGMDACARSPVTAVS
jgi:hypothetical protein